MSHQHLQFVNHCAASLRVILSLIEAPHRQVREGGIVFCRESCFKQSGDIKRDENPTHYRNPRDYFAIFDGVQRQLPDGRHAHFELVSCKCVDTYVRIKKNQNQICWKLRKVGKLDSKLYSQPELGGPLLMSVQCSEGYHYIL